MSLKQICPWCQMEIVWDEEIGPEEECPHCLNELKDYRTLTIDMKQDGGDEDQGDYADAVDQVLAMQSEDAPDCEQCQEGMVLAGRQTVEKQSFVSHAYEEDVPPLLQAPYRQLVYVCPSCFQVKTVLDEEGRQAFVHALRQMGNLK